MSTPSPVLVAARQEPVLAARTWLAAGEARGLRVPALGDQADGHVLEHLEVPLDAVAAAGGAGTPAARPDAVAADPHRERALEGLDGVFRVFVMPV